MNHSGIRIYLCGTLFILFPLFSVLMAQPGQRLGDQSEELGMVRWYRDYDKAIQAAQSENKDIVLLFQEVPGCATCRNYGHHVLSHPLMVEAIEHSFIPLAIFNNKSGKDREILEKFKEPSWNNPVVRIIDAKANNVVPRISRDYSALTLCRRMIQALEQRNREVPVYIRLLEQELAADQATGTDESYFKMYCFWTGEKELGKLDGVLNVEAGFIGSSEVVKVDFDPDKLSEKQLTLYAQAKNCAPIDPGQGYRTAKNDVRYYLQHSNYQYLPLSELQKTRINSALGSRQPAEQFLSPTQLKWLRSIKPHMKGKLQPLYDQDLASGWRRKV